MLLCSCDNHQGEATGNSAVKGANERWLALLLSRESNLPCKLQKWARTSEITTILQGFTLRTSIVKYIRLFTHYQYDVIHFFGISNVFGTNHAVSKYSSNNKGVQCLGQRAVVIKGQHKLSQRRRGRGSELDQGWVNMSFCFMNLRLKIHHWQLLDYGRGICYRFWGRVDGDR